MNDGFVKIHRKILDNPIVCRDAEYFSVWCYLLLNATHTGIKMMFDGKVIELKPGQLITGRKSISAKFNISESKVQRVLKKLEIEQQIEQQTSPRKRLITVLNWSKYQIREQQNEHLVNNNRTTTEQQLNTNKNVRKKEGEESKKKTISTPKIKFADFVSMTEEEHEKLLADYGESKTNEMIERLNEYKGSNGKKYKSDYLTCKGWFRRDGVKPQENVKDWTYQGPLEDYDEEKLDF